MVKFRIVADSSSDMLNLSDIPFSIAPLKIITDNKEFIDNKDLKVEEMVSYLASYKGKSSTSCPNPSDWLTAFGDANYIFCVTITSNLSGCYNAALVAKEMYEEMYDGRKVFVLNSLSTGPEMKLIVEKLCELIHSEKEFEDICEEITKYTEKTGLLFMLESMRNLANNGRVNPIKAKAAGLLGIRAVGKASDIGDLQLLDKCRGQEKALASLFGNIKELGHKSGKVRIAHCQNTTAAEKLKALILEDSPSIDIEIYNCGGLCSFYAEKGGLLVGFEKC